MFNHDIYFEDIELLSMYIFMMNKQWLAVEKYTALLNE